MADKPVKLGVYLVTKGRVADNEEPLLSVIAHYGAFTFFFSTIDMFVMRFKTNSLSPIPLSWFAAFRYKFGIRVGAAYQAAKACQGFSDDAARKRAGMFTVLFGLAVIADKDPQDVMSDIDKDSESLLDMKPAGGTETYGEIAAKLVADNSAWLSPDKAGVVTSSN